MSGIARLSFEHLLLPQISIPKQAFSRLDNFFYRIRRLELSIHALKIFQRRIDRIDLLSPLKKILHLRVETRQGITR